MKHFLIAAAAIPITFGTADAALIDDLTCLTITECKERSLKPYCCPTGAFKNSCPDGWHSSGSTCTRDQTTGSDNIGYYTQTYGTCAADKVPCYKGSNTQMQNSDGEYCIEINGGGAAPVNP